jgi:hypothetical protein
MTRVSAPGVAVLEACWNGAVSINSLVRHSSQRRLVARASISRTLRRLWRAGLIELANDWNHTLTQHYAAIDAKLAAHVADPEGTFAATAETIMRHVEQGGRWFWPFTTAPEYLAWAQRKAGEDRRRACHMRYVRITPAGRDYLERLTLIRTEVNRSEQPETVGAMTGQPVRKLSGHVRGRTGRTTPPLKGVSVRCPVSAGKQIKKSWRQRARDERLGKVREVRAALRGMLPDCPKP